MWVDECYESECEQLFILYVGWAWGTKQKMEGNLKNESWCLILLMCDILRMIQTFLSILSPSFSLCFFSTFVLCMIPIGQTTCSWWRFTNEECEWMARLLTSAYRELNSDMKRLRRHIALKAGFYEPYRHTAKSAFKNFFPHLPHCSPAPHPLNAHLVKQRWAPLRITLFLFFVCSWLAICLEMNSLPGFPEQTEKVKELWS